jgi:hypothetical protein
MNSNHPDVKLDQIRKYVLIAVVVTPILYVILALILLLQAEGIRWNEFQPFYVFLVFVVACMAISILYLVKHWRIEEGESLQKTLVVDLVRLAMIQSIALIGLFYFVFALLR